MSRCLIKWKSRLYSCFFVGFPLLWLSLSFCLSISFSICSIFISMLFYLPSSLSPFSQSLRLLRSHGEKQKTHSVWPYKNCRASIRPAFFGATTSLGDDFLEVELPLYLNNNCLKRAVGQNLFCKDIYFFNTKSTDCKDFLTMLSFNFASLFIASQNLHRKRLPRELQLRGESDAGNPPPDCATRIARATLLDRRDRL